MKKEMRARFNAIDQRFDNIDYRDSTLSNRLTRLEVKEMESVQEYNELTERVEKLEAMADTKKSNLFAGSFTLCGIDEIHDAEKLREAIIKDYNLYPEGLSKDMADILGAKYKEPEKPTIFVNIDDSNITGYVGMGGRLISFTANNLPKLDINRTDVVLYGGLEWKITGIKYDNDSGVSIQCARVN